MITANKGEWSELYVLFKLLSDKRLYACDRELNKINSYYPLISFIREESEKNQTVRYMYTISDHGQGELVELTANNTLLNKIPVSEFAAHAEILFNHIKKGSTGKSKGAFAIPEISDFLQEIRCTTVKAKSGDKGDIQLIMHDQHTNTDSALKFSIKSEMGSKSSLLNASAQTNMLYTLHGNTDDALALEVNAIDSKNKVKDRIKTLQDRGVSFRFEGFSGRCFENNLRMIDNNMPAILGEMVLNSYISADGKNIRSLLADIKEKNPCNYDTSYGHDFYTYKMQSFLSAVALGMRPATAWDGRYEATGGYIIVKENGDVICLHIYDRNVLEEYLLNHSKFDTPTSDSNKIKGTRYLMYKDNGKWYFNLNLQIRFI